MTAESPAPEASPSAPAAGGIKKKNLILIALVFAGLWAMAISSKSIVFLSITGALTVLAAGIAFWAWRQIRRHRDLAGMLQGAAASPEARREALAKLSADPKAKDITNVIARAQLLSSDDPAAALALLEPIELKQVPAQMQDDLALLKAQLLLTFGRAKQARPLADWVNLDNPQRADARPIMAAIVAETWARTGSATEASALLDSVDADAADANTRAHLLMARAFAHFAAGKKGATRATLGQLAGIDPNLLGRFVAPQFKVHPGLQRLAREAAERHAPRRDRRMHVAAGRRGRVR